jgi:hypothetical protein
MKRNIPYEILKALRPVWRRGRPRGHLAAGREIDLSKASRQVCEGAIWCLTYTQENIIIDWLYLKVCIGPHGCITVYSCVWSIWLNMLVDQIPSVHILIIGMLIGHMFICYQIQVIIINSLTIRHYTENQFTVGMQECFEWKNSEAQNHLRKLLCDNELNSPPMWAKRPEDLLNLAMSIPHLSDNNYSHRNSVDE